MRRNHPVKPPKRFHPIPSHPEFYVSRSGEVWGILGLMKTVKNQYGYSRFAYASHPTRLELVSRAVCETFHGVPKTKMTVDHINGVKSDNRACNLRWMLHSENAAQGSRSRRLITNNKARRIYLMYLKERSYRIVAERFGVSINMVASIARRRTYRDATMPIGDGNE